MALNGGKHYLAERIIELMPPHTHYVEPYFGGGQVLFAKPHEGVSEVVNDLNANLMCFWKTLQDERLFDKFKRMCEATPLSAPEFHESLTLDRVLTANWYADPDDVIRSAHSFFVRYRQSRQGLGKDFATLSRNRTRRGMNEQVSSWLTAVEGLPEAHERLKRVAILCDDAAKVIEQQDGEKTQFYLDPPYLDATRVSKQAYEHEMTREQHEKLLATLANIRGKFILSGYHSDLYDDFAHDYRWRLVEIPIDNKASSASIKETKTECLWMNY